MYRICKTETTLADTMCSIGKYYYTILQYINIFRHLSFSYLMFNDKLKMKYSFSGIEANFIILDFHV